MIYNGETYELWVGKTKYLFTEQELEDIMEQINGTTRKDLLDEIEQLENLVDLLEKEVEELEEQIQDLS